MSGRCRGVVLGLLLAGASCARLPAPVALPVSPVVAELAARGDVEFAKMHWSGWKNAAEFYEQALKTAENRRVRRQLVYSYALRFVREFELGHLDRQSLERARQLAEGLGEHQVAKTCRSLSLIGDRFRPYYLPRVEPPPDVPDPLIPGADLDYLLYLNTFIARGLRPGSEADGLAEKFQKAFPDSPLTLFSRAEADEAKLRSMLDEHPDFVEARLFLARLQERSRRTWGALAGYREVVGVMPFLAQVHVSMGTICVGWEDEEAGLTSFRAAREVEPLLPKALFGEAVCLTGLDRLDEADAVLQVMLDEQTYFHGEACYYLARNQYRRGRRAEAREYLEKARSFIPDSIELNMLSGILHFEQGNRMAARADFERVLEQNDFLGDAHYYLGRIACGERNLVRAAGFFDRAAENYLLEVLALDQRRLQLAGEEMEEAGRRKLEQRLAGKRRKLVAANLTRLEEMARILTGGPVSKFVVRNLEILRLEAGGG